MADEQTWISVDSQSDLDALDAAACWLDSGSTVEFYGLSRSERYFPSDISRSGHEHPNLHLWGRVSSRFGDLLHVVLIDCDWYYSPWISEPHFQGRVDTLRRIEVHDGCGSTRMRCSRVIYRFHWDDGTFEIPCLAHHLLQT